MATKDERPGLLSKVAMFVRNPTKDWSDISRTETEPDSAYDKQALKAMIERKRQNDFVRKREFDQLRKLRNRDPSAVANLARPSFFQSSIPTDPDGRAVTLKKIDEIEAQMSRQWWKGKQDAAAAANAGSEQRPSAVAPGSDTQPSLAPSGASAGTRYGGGAAASTLPIMRGVPDQPVAGAPQTEYAATQMGQPTEPMFAAPESKALGSKPAFSRATESSDLSFTTSKLLALEVSDAAADPELEEAAIRFANGDDHGAESSLISALRRGVADASTAFNWAAALMDFYRATQNRERFDWAIVEFAHLWDERVPRWDVVQLNTAFGAETTLAAPFVPEPVAGEYAEAGPMWSCPQLLDVPGMEALRLVLSTQPMPWTLDWTALERIDAPAMPLLSGLFASLCDEPVSLRFGGASQLLAALQLLTPSANRSVDSAWWIVRLNVLRALQRLDDFELVALDYCITYEVSPPAWAPARCDYSAVHFRSTDAASADFVSTAPMGVGSVTLTSQELRGVVAGDTTALLAGLDSARDQSNNIVISCRFLVRVDFSAAGTILNWVVSRQAEGCMVQFQDVHRLVAAFFNVIGISEHARVVPRDL
ncbi:MAG: STAS domain-containing protein [Rhodoferax sp.]|uniref:STAS domain-containing protein n=1 Tax=Rhodoferax sp. TaxID=50421 RepID=UPI002ACD8532|nr:STAS domain-containing protein [Rhodoferax sp.]MDZ7891068.1 STAS domain-containing protein [Rhodoferax sp.]